jgi:DNA-binding transcriptional ArsR family regulator
MLNQSDCIDTLFQALADPVRRALVERLAEGPTSVSSLARTVPVSLPGVMQHLAVLEAAGLVVSHKQGRVRTCTLSPSALAPVSDWVDSQRGRWTQRFDALGRYLRDTDPKH